MGSVCCTLRERGDVAPAHVPKELPGDWRSLKGKLEGRLYTPEDKDYDAARGCHGKEGVSNIGGKWRATWNADAIGSPSGIACVKSVEEVQEVVKFAASCLDQGLLFCIAAGRHSHQCMMDDSLVLDISRLDKVEVFPQEKKVIVQGGAQQGQIDVACKPHKLATTAGHNATTGIGGLVLQGGHGYLERKFGLAIDNLLSCDVVLATGAFVTCSEKQNADLFWALRGGGGNFGVVVSFTFCVHDFPEQVYAGTRIHAPLEFCSCPGRAELISGFCKTFKEGPNDAVGVLILPSGGPVIESLVWVGDNADEGKDYFEKRKQGRPLRNDMKMQSYHDDVQRQSPVELGYGYQSGVLLDDFCPEAIEALAGRMLKKNSPNSMCTVILLPLGGKMSEPAPSSSANPHRNQKFWVLIGGAWTPVGNASQDLEMRGKVVAWVRSVKDALMPFTTGHYAVLADANNGRSADTRKAHQAEEGGAVGMFVGQRNIYGDNLPRLQEIKAKYDPLNLFRLNDNISPSSDASNPLVSS